MARIISRHFNRDALNARAALIARHVRSRHNAGIAAPRKIALPRQQTPATVWREYAAAIIRLVMPVVRSAMEPLLAALPRLTASAARDRALAMHADANEGTEVRDLVDLARTRIAEAITTDDLDRLARQFADRTATFNKAQLSRQLEAALGTDVFIADRRLRPLVDAFVDVNVGLIKDIGDKLANDIEQTTMRAIQAGTLHGDLATELESRFGIAEDRAKLIARDQVGKAYGQINAARQRELGVDKFIWRTVHDDRVRDEHDARDGETYDYNDPPDGELPGEPINCRCYAEPVLDDILSEADNSGPDPIPVEPASAASPTIESAPPTTSPDFAPPDIAPTPASPDEFVAEDRPKNPKRVEAARKAAAASVERRREIHSAVATNLPQELQVAWEKEGHKFIREESARIKGVKDRVNAASKLSEAFAEKYGSGDQTAFGNEGDRFQKRAELEAAHATKWADEQEQRYYQDALKEAQRNGEIDDSGELAGHDPAPTPHDWRPPPVSSDDDPPF